MHGDGHPALESACEIIAFHHARHRVARRQLNKAAGTELVAPFRVVANLGARRVKHHAGLRVIRLGVFVNLLGGERRPCGVAPAWIADERGEVTDQEKDRKSTRLNSSHVKSSYAVFCLKKK